MFWTSSPFFPVRPLATPRYCIFQIVPISSRAQPWRYSGPFTSFSPLWLYDILNHSRPSLSCGTTLTIFWTIHIILSPAAQPWRYFERFTLFSPLRHNLDDILNDSHYSLPCGTTLSIFWTIHIILSPAAQPWRYCERFTSFSALWYSLYAILNYSYHSFPCGVHHLYTSPCPIHSHHPISMPPEPNPSVRGRLCLGWLVTSWSPATSDNHVA